MKILPTNADKTKTMEEAAYAEYAVCVPEDGEYKFTVYTAPSNNLDRDKVCISYGYSINGETLVEKNTVDADTFLAGEYSGSWANDVKVNGRKQENNIHLNAGVNTIRIYSDDPAFLLQKLVVSEKSVKSSNAGRKKVIMLVKNRQKKQRLQVFLQMKMYFREQLPRKKQHIRQVKPLVPRELYQNRKVILPV